MQEELSILLVEDHAGDQFFFEDTLKKLGLTFRLSIVQSCVDALSAMEKEIDYDLIFLDLNIPGVNGKDCLKEIKANEKYRNIPVIIFSGKHSQEDIDDVYESGAHYHVIKPYAYINYMAALKYVFQINWKDRPPVPAKEKFVINYTYKN